MPAKDPEVPERTGPARADQHRPSRAGSVMKPRWGDSLLLWVAGTFHLSIDGLYDRRTVRMIVKLGNWFSALAARDI